MKIINQVGSDIKSQILELTEIIFEEFNDDYCGKCVKQMKR
jgi:hypothetical protein